MVPGILRAALVEDSQDFAADTLALVGYTQVVGRMDFVVAGNSVVVPVEFG